MPKVPTDTPDVEGVLLQILNQDTEYEWYSRRPARETPYKLGMLRADVQGLVTPISRYCRVGLEGWSVDGSGSSRLDEAFDLVAAGAKALEATNHFRVLDVEVQSGPARVVDNIQRLEFQYLTALLEVSVT